MARIVGGIGSSHTPTIEFALDAGKQADPVWAPIFAGYEPVQKWLQDKRPDVLFFIYNDHVTSSWEPALALAVRLSSMAPSFTFTVRAA